ncbi:unnamed protein product [Rangifer tarandus platyrhynchus]|uniref:Uncharacterized protein n=2 Tax=Rangifer tarandus platyrhynchus TaxID=3082113 RepID=A0ABN8ZZ58_RANTA|nr:unnamed protein product [Rangifer tarandus platyrhynchus]
MLPDTTLAVDSMPWPMAPVQAGWKLPAASSREGTCETVKGCVNHAPVLGGVSPNTSNTYKEKRKKEPNSKPPLPSRMCCGSRCPLQPHEGSGLISPWVTFANRVTVFGCAPPGDAVRGCTIVDSQVDPVGKNNPIGM